jgi:hypothetical protein
MITALFLLSLFVSLFVFFFFYTVFDFPQKRLGRVLTSLIDEYE